MAPAIGRRRFLGAIALPAGAAACRAVLRDDAPARIAGLASQPGTPEEIAADEDFWLEVQRAFTVDRSHVNLNNGGVCSAPASVQDSMRRYLEQAHGSPAYVLWRLQDPRKETVRDGLARLFGCDAEEVAITRNASEGLENLQLGLDLRPGDEVLTTDQDYPRMITTWRQRERRDGLVLRQIELPVPCEDPAEAVRRFEAAIGPRTRVVHLCHVINLTGQVLPVREIVRAARARGLPTIVDGAHSFAHLAFERDELDCDYFATSLHKFLHAPHGTGMLYVRRAAIRGVWPLMPAPEALDEDIRKFEEIGTHPLANTLAISDALLFHEGIGSERKQARLWLLRDRWARRLAEHPRVRLHTSLAPGRSSGVATVEIEGVDPARLHDHLWTRERIYTVAILHPRFRGIRVSPAVHTTLDEIDRFAEAMERVAEHGLPA